MKTKDTGGQAFASGSVLKARARPGDPGSDFIVTAKQEPLHPGMTLRDYFAAKALQGFLSDPDVGLSEAELVATAAYKWADAMLIARMK